MSMRIPKDVEQLMWLIAESGDSNAAHEFEHRFPDYRFELMRRMSTVKSLRESKPHEKVSVPAFTMKSGPASSAKPRAFMVGVFALGLGVFAFGSYAITKQFMPPAEKVPVEVVQPDVPVTVIPKLQGDPSYTQNPPGISTQLPGQASGSTAGGQGGQLGPTDEQPLTKRDASKESYNQLRDLSIENAPLESVIAMIGQASGLQVEIMPNANTGPTVDFARLVSVDYRQMSGIDMLRRLGEEYHFTLSPQGPGSFLVIPSPAKQPILGSGE